MRLSTGMFYELGLRGIQRQLADQLDLQQKVSAGRRVLKPSDDPMAAASVIGLDQAKGLNTQYSANASTANASLGLEEQALADAMRVLQDVKSLAITAGNPVMKNEDRVSLATQVRALYDELLGIANRTNGEGEYLFSGYKGTTKPFSESAPGVVAYAGDESERLLQIAPQRRIAASDSGADVFQRIRAGNGTFVASTAGANTGTAIIDAGTVKTATAWGNPANSRDYSIVFYVDTTVSPPVTTYDIVDNVAGLSMLTGVAPAAGPFARTYQPGVAIAFSRQPGDPSIAPWDTGVEAVITGAPNSGDTFTVERSPMQDVFATLYDLVDTLNTGVSLVPASRAVYQNNLNATGASLDHALDHILTARAATGTRMVEIESTQETNQDLHLRYEEERSRLIDLDYAAALGEITRKQVSLEAAQKSYVAVTRLNLFDFL
jgi:flagellar hook-associated protein 3 FlgL